MEEKDWYELAALPSGSPLKKRHDSIKIGLCHSIYLETEESL